MNDKNEAMQQALKLIERLNKHGWILADFEEEVYASITALKAALEQQQVGPVEDMLLRRAVLRSAKIVSDGRFVTKQAALEQPPLPVQEPVSMRMPKVGDKVICLEDESLGEVVSLTAGGSPDIKFADGSHGTYLLREFAELFGYVNSPQQQAEPVTWDKPSASFDEWWDGDRRRDTANPFTTDSFSYWAFEGWQAALAQPLQEPLAWLYPEGLKALQNGKCWTAYPTQHEDCNTPLYIAMPPMPVQRPWVGLTEQDMPSGKDPMFDHKYFIAGMVYAAKVLQDKNHG